MLTCDGVVIKWCPTCQLPPVGGLASSGISAMVGPGAGWTWVCHRFPLWIFWMMHHPLDLRLLVFIVVSTVAPVSDHGGVFISVTWGGIVVAQYRAFRASRVLYFHLVSLR